MSHELGYPSQAHRLVHNENFVNLEWEKFCKKIITVHVGVIFKTSMSFPYQCHKDAIFG